MIIDPGMICSVSHMQLLSSRQAKWRGGEGPRVVPEGTVAQDVSLSHASGPMMEAETREHTIGRHKVSSTPTQPTLLYVATPHPQFT